MPKSSRRDASDAVANTIADEDNREERTALRCAHSSTSGVLQMLPLPSLDAATGGGEKENAETDPAPRVVRAYARDRSLVVLLIFCFQRQSISRVGFLRIRSCCKRVSVCCLSCWRSEVGGVFLCVLLVPVPSCHTSDDDATYKRYG